MVNKKINVHNKGLLLLIILSVAMGTLLAGISNYIPRSAVYCGYKCSGFPFISTAQNIPNDDYDYPRECENILDHVRCGIGSSRYLNKNNFIPTNFILNAIFYSFITFGLVSATSLTIKKRTNANPRN